MSTRLNVTTTSLPAIKSPHFLNLSNLFDDQTVKTTHTLTHQRLEGEIYSH